MAITSAVKLSSGSEMPVIGLGTSFSTDSAPPDQAEVEEAVKNALQIGYRHIDCAPVYQNEAAVGRGIKASGIPRKELFITSKLWNTEHDPIDVGSALEQTLKDLGTDYVDLYLIHWPSSWVKQSPYTFFPEDDSGNMITNTIPLASTWKAMEDLVVTGKAKSIGLSNFYKYHRSKNFSPRETKIMPAVNQIQAHPYTPRNALVEWCLSKNIHVTAWGPLTTDRDKNLSVANDARLIESAKSISVTPAQLALSWAVQRGTSVIPKSSNRERLRPNLEIIELPAAIMAQVDGLGNAT